MHERLAGWADSVRPPFTLVTLEWEQAPRLGDELDQTATALARAALTLYPALYLSAEQRERDSASRDSSERVVLTAASRIREVSAGAAEHIVRACQAGELPILSNWPLGERVRQLALALDPNRLLIELLVHSSEPAPRGVLFAFGRGAEWLARNANARAVVIVPGVFSSSAELDAVSYGAARPGPGGADSEPARPDSDNDNDYGKGRARRRGRRKREQAAPETAPAAGVATILEAASFAGARASVASGAAATSAPIVSVGAVTGQPHPGSQAEQVLHARLVADPELGPLFHFNRLVPTTQGNRPRVDLLWPAGKLVIEIDGHRDHSRLDKFCLDRERDYELLLSGYHVVRFPEYLVLLDLQLTLERIRRVVRYLTQVEGS